MIPIRCAMPFAAIALIAGCTADATNDAAPLETPSIHTTTPGGEHTFTPRSGEVLTLEKGGDMVTLREGRYEAWRIGSSTPYEVDVPDRWRVLAGTYLNAASPGQGIFLIASLPSNRTDLAVHPCRDHTLFRIGPTVSDFVTAFSEQPVWQVSKPRAVTLDGIRAVYLEVELPANVDPAECVDGQVSEYESGRDGLATEESYKGRWWVLEVAGERLVVMARCYDTCTEDDLDIMSAMAESITFPRS